jgi:hypothetical protein
LMRWNEVKPLTVLMRWNEVKPLTVLMGWNEGSSGVTGKERLR